MSLKFTKTKTERGFDLITFQDYNGVECNVQQSSLATDNAIWIGCAEANPQVLIPGEGWKPLEVPENFIANNRMHLTREQVGYLLPLLQEFYETGRLRAGVSRD